MNVANGDVTQGDTLFEYLGSGPPEKTGLHRYVFLVFEQPGKLDVSNIPKRRNCDRDGRPKTKTAELISEFALSQPVFGNYYQAEYDDYVLELRKQLSGCSN